MRWQSSISAAFPKGQGTFPRATVVLTKKCTEGSGQPWTGASKLQAHTDFMIKNSKNKSKQGNQFKTYSYFVGDVLTLVKQLFVVVVSLLFFSPVCW